MRKIAIILGLTAIAAAPVVATTLCAADDVIVVALDPMVAGTNYKYDTETFEWYTTFTYGTVFGLATCVDTTGTYGVAVDELKSQDGSIATGGERTGTNCWCRLTHPVASKWVARGVHPSVYDCGLYCANFCSRNVRDDAASRRSLFGAIEQ